MRSRSRPYLRRVLVLASLCACAPDATPVDAEPAIREEGLVKLEYPLARRSNVVEQHHGVSVADPYRWLEDIDGAETRSWLAAEQALTARVLSGVPGRERVAEGLERAFDVERASAPEQAGARFFFTRNSGLQDQAVLYVADALDGEPRVLLDPATLSPDGSLAFVGYRPSPQGSYVAYGVSAGGGDWTEWRVREVATGKDLPDRLEWTKYYAPDWSADEQSLYYSRFPEPAQGSALTARDLGCAVRQHRLGTASGSADPVLFARPEHPTWSTSRA